MDNTRMFLLLAMAMVLMLIYNAWEQQNAPVPPPAAVAPVAAPAPAIPGTATPAAPVAAPTVSSDVPSVPATAAPARAESEAFVRGQRIQIRTDLLQAEVDTQGGDLRQLNLVAYPVSLETPNVPFVLMHEAGPELLVAQTGLIGSGDEFPTHNVRYQIAAAQYVMAEGQNELRVPLTWKSPGGVRYTKTYVFHRGSYVIDVEFGVENTARTEWNGYLYGRFQRAHTQQTGFFNVNPSYTGGAIYTPTDKYEKIALDDMAKKPLKRETTGGWVAMLQHYFVSSFLLPKDARLEFFSDVQGPRHILGFKNMEPARVAPGRSGTVGTRIYAGPKEQKILKTLPEGMDLTVDYGWLTVISAPLFWLLEWIHKLLGNWGWAIIVLTIIIKAAFYPLSAASYKSMAQMKKLQPRMTALKERFGDDRQKLNQAMMELYKTEKINPLGGCLPILIQIPVFIALYWVLLESVEMRQAPWTLWIKDLSAQDPYYVLPLLMGVSMYAQQLLNPQPVDPIQRKVFLFMPGIFTVMFLFFPAGLVLYWTVNNILSIAQQWQINRTLGVSTK
jgi:YidC/Oxa1 family membrane protein insertase